MAYYAWATDLHLEFLGADNNLIVQLAEQLVSKGPTGIFLTGDISVSHKLVQHLAIVDKTVQRPTYFVLGNHDMYGSSTETVRKAMRELTNVSPFLRYMPTMLYQPLTALSAVVGADCWYDAQLGNWKRSTMGLSDWTSIQDFRLVNGNRATIVEQARKLAHEGVTHIAEGIKQATRYHKNIIVLSHVPPYAQCHVYNGQQGDDNAMPWFTCKLLGDVMLDAAKAYPNVQFTVLAGHTHGKCEAKITKNLKVLVGGAEYGKPALQGTVEVP